MKTSKKKSKYGLVDKQDFELIASCNSVKTVNLWALCWQLDPYGNKFVKIPQSHIDTLSESAFKRARKFLKENNLFEFCPVCVIGDSRKTAYWTVRNQKGSKSHLFGLTNKKTSKYGKVAKKIAYLKFLKSPYWQQVRLIVLQRDNHTCKSCGSVSNLQVHHLSYEHHRDELNHLEDLITLCKSCHESVHEY